MQEIENASVVDGEIVGGNLILSRHDGTTIDAGSAVGPQGPEGPSGIGIPGEIKMWPGGTLPVQAEYGLWVWANGDVFDVAAYPKAAANIAMNWKTAMGQPNPGVGKFRVPDLRGLVPAGLDAMPEGSARANRLTRAVAITIAAKTGEEQHIITIPEMPSHWHGMGTNTVVWVDGGAFNQNFTKAGTDQVIRGINQTAPAGGSQAHENVQPTIFVAYIVKLDDPAAP
jgi:microcystin-dependent protein